MLASFHCGLIIRIASGKLAIRPDHPRRRIEVKVCMPGDLWCQVLLKSVKWFCRCGWSKIALSPLLWPLAYTTGCTTVQAVIQRNISETVRHTDIIDIQTVIERLRPTLYATVSFRISLGDFE